MQTAASGNKEEKNWKKISGIFPLSRDIQEPKPKALGMRVLSDICIHRRLKKKPHLLNGVAPIGSK
jgi:hypothetical protein